MRSIVSVKYPKQLETTIAAPLATCNFSFLLALTTRECRPDRPSYLSCFPLFSPACLTVRGAAFALPCRSLASLAAVAGTLPAPSALYLAPTNPQQLQMQFEVNAPSQNVERLPSSPCPFSRPICGPKWATTTVLGAGFINLLNILPVSAFRKFFFVSPFGSFLLCFFVERSTACHSSLHSPLAHPL